jgi:hypothetical protein
MDAYSIPDAMEPLLPVAGRGTLAKLACEILAAFSHRTGQVHAPEVLRRIAGQAGRWSACHRKTAMPVKAAAPALMGSRSDTALSPAESAVF